MTLRFEATLKNAKLNEYAFTQTMRSEATLRNV
jgi:hypothetical protein